MQDIYTENYTLELFNGQGVRHPNFGYGMVLDVDRNVVTVLVGEGKLMCRREDLQPARLSEADLLDLQEKYYPVLEAEVEVKAHSAANFRGRKPESFGYSETE